MTPYGEKAMVQELGILRSVGDGDRNNALNLAAYRLSQLIAKGHIDESALVTDLEAAAVSIGLHSKEALSTIQSGIRKGRAETRGPEPGAGAQAAPRIRPLTSPAQIQRDWFPDPTPAAPAGIWQQKAAAFVEYCCNTLLKSPDRVAYLERRGISEITAKWYKLGWFAGENGKDAFRPRSAWGLPPEIKEDGSEKKLWLPPGLVIPWMDVDGVHRIRIRREANDPRYYVLPGCAMDCFLMPKASFHRAYIVVESELDGIMLDQAVSDMCGVIALGNSSRKPDRRTWAALTQAARVLVSLDNDEAGNHSAAWWTTRLRNAVRFPAPEGKDPGEAYEKGMDLREWVKSGLPQGWFITQRRASG